MSQSTKPLSDRDSAQVHRRAWNEANDTLGVDGFIVGAIGRKIIKVNVSPAVEAISFYQDQTTLMYTLTITYTDSTKADLVSVERTA